MHLEIKRKLFWYVRIVSKNGEVLLTSETYYSRSNAERALKKLSGALNLKVKETK